MSVPIYVYMTLPLEFINVKGVFPDDTLHKYYTSKIKYILNKLYESEYYNEIVSINYIVKEEEQYNNIINNFKFRYRYSSRPILPPYLTKMKCLIRPNASDDNTSIMSEMYYHVARNSGCFFNILFLDLKKILEVNYLYIEDWMKHLVFNNWMFFLIYFYITNANECIGNLSNANVCGVDLIETSSYPYYYSNWWWTNSNYIKTLHYFNNKCTPHITNGIYGGLYVSLWTSIKWLSIKYPDDINYVNKYTPDYYEDKDLNISYVSMENGYVEPINLSCFKPIIPDENMPYQINQPKQIFSLNIYKNNTEIPIKKYIKPEITPCEYRDRLLRWNRPKPKSLLPKPPVPIFMFSTVYSKK
jgi:hypothetical protein